MTTAVQKLRPSVLVNENRLRQQDIDLSSLKLALKGSASLDIEENVIDGDIERTIDGASTVTITLLDRDRNILNSGKLKDGCDINLDGLWFRLVSVRKQGNHLTLIFEDREVAILRLYRKKRIVKRGKMTRERFVENMIREVRETKIPYVIPALELLPAKDFAPKVRSTGTTQYERRPGFAPNPAITVRGITATYLQILNTDKVLQVGASMGAPRSCMVAAIEVINEESNASNLPYGDRDSIGLFQQRIQFYGTKEQLLNIEFSAGIFFRGAIKAYNSNPAQTPEEIAVRAQLSGTTRLWIPYRQEAERTVSRWGFISGSTPLANANAQDSAAYDTASSGRNGAYAFTRGLPAVVNGVKKVKLEDTWTCTGRMADEVQMRRFMSAGTFFFISEMQLFMSAPRMRVTEETDGIDSIDFIYDTGRHHSQSDNSHTANVTITAWVDKWDCPPGATIEIYDMGMLDGRWLITSITRSLFSQKATIVAKKPRPKLPEPNLDREALVDRALGTVLDHPSTLDAPRGPMVLETPVAGSAASMAKQILDKHTLGFYSDDNGRQIEQLKQVAAGRQLTNSGGQKVSMNPKVLGAILTLLNSGYYVGSYALVSDHSYNVRGGGVSQHSLGEAIDISSVGNSATGRRVIGDGKSDTTLIIKEVMLVLRKLYPWDLICAGNGQFDPSVANLQLDNTAPKGGEWVSGHRDHIHVSFARGSRDQP